MQKRLMTKIVSLLVVLFAANVAYGQDQSLWKEYKAIFIAKDGRTIDYYQDKISHSESQGYAMLLAVAYNDAVTFEKLWRWTKNNLRVRNDSLFAWSWGKRPNGQWQVIEYNNATDGDILIASSLLKAAEKWPSKNNFKKEGLKIIKSIRKNLAVERFGHTFLLPGYYGFTRGDSVILNLSYLIFPAFRYFEEKEEKVFWEKIRKDASFLMSQSLFGKLHLPADWIIFKETGVSIFPEKKAYFGYEAIRVFLYLSWEEKPQFPEGLKAILNIYKKHGYFPRWVDLKKNSFSLKPASAGSYAIYALASRKIGEKRLSKKIFKEARKKLSKEKKNYYSFSLFLLAEGSNIL